MVSASAGAQLLAEFIVKAPDMISFIASALVFILEEGEREPFFRVKDFNKLVLC